MSMGWQPATQPKGKPPVEKTKGAETMTRLIDADALTTAVLKKAFEDALLSGNTDMHKLLISIVAHQPTVDAVPVIRCKDCKHYYVLNEFRGNCSEYNFVEKIPIDYCSWAERKEE